MGIAASSESKFHFDGSAVLGSLSRIVESIAAQRQAKADVFVRPYLARLPEEELSALGFSKEEVAKIKTCGDKHIRYQV